LLTRTKSVVNIRRRKQILFRRQFRFSP